MESPVKSTSAYKNLTLEEAYQFLNANNGGLSDAEAQQRLAIQGHNEIVEKQRNYFLEFIIRFWGPMPWLLEIACGLSIALNHYVEGLIIASLLVVNAIIGQIHMYGAQKTITLLRQKLANKSKVLRNNAWGILDAKNIVTGDIISVKSGDIIPADTMIISGELSVDQSALTGESLPVDTRAPGIVYAGSIVKRNDGTGIVINTGVNTFFGKTAELVKIAEPKSHQEMMMMTIVTYMIYLGLAASIIVLLSALLMHLSFMILITFIIVVLLGAIPAALPAVLTIMQTVSATELAKKGALISRLESVEDAASIDIICFDKTGTITQNKLSVVTCAAFSGYSTVDVLRIAALTSQAKGMDLIDLAVLDYVKQTGVEFNDYKQITYTPFDPSTKKTEAIIEKNGSRCRAVKGASQTILALCGDNNEALNQEVKKNIDEYSKKGFRTIAIAVSDSSNFDNLKLIGLLPITDPARPDSKSMIEQMRVLGIKPMMLTGDSIEIAREIANETGIGINIIRMSDIRDLSQDKQMLALSDCDGFAEIYPEDKYSIVKMLQSGGHAVGMTGDGVNDAPALRQAEMGIAVNNSTDVAKAAASVVLTDTGIEVIVDAITVSRRAYQRMLTWVLNKVVKVIEFVVFLSIGFFWMRDILLTLIGMSFLVFANDFVSMSLATDNVKSTINPDNWNLKSIILAALIPSLCYVVADIIIVLLGIYYFHLVWPQLTSLVMLSFIFNSQFRVLIVRERKHFWHSVPGKGLLIATSCAITGIALIAILGILVPPLSLSVVLCVLGLSAFFSFLIDFPKYYAFKKFGL